jgi:hypothetical protein
LQILRRLQSRKSEVAEGLARTSIRIEAQRLAMQREHARCADEINVVRTRLP